MVCMDSDITPFKGRNAVPASPTRLLRRFIKGGRVAEIHERTVTSFKGIEFMILLDALRESQMFHGRRLEEYSAGASEACEAACGSRWIEQCVDAES